jgi:hydroxymethylglutaryl-CoA synthase
MFSYGSGLAATMFSLRVAQSTQQLAEKLNLVQRLDSRTAVAPADFEKVCLLVDDLFTLGYDVARRNPQSQGI